MTVEQPAANFNHDIQHCANCKTSETPLWRRSSEGDYLCNSCGLYYRKHLVHRTLPLSAGSVKKQRIRCKSLNSVQSPFTLQKKRVGRSNSIASLNQISEINYQHLGSVTHNGKLFRIGDGVLVVQNGVERHGIIREFVENSSSFKINWIDVNRSGRGDAAEVDLLPLSCILRVARVKCMNNHLSLSKTRFVGTPGLLRLPLPQTNLHLLANQASSNIPSKSQDELEAAVSLLQVHAST